jgi:carboxymethylenebutenolidase
VSGDTEVPALIARPRGKAKFPAVLYMHGRRGLDDLIQLQVKRLAARGFVVLAPDVYKAHFLPPMPIEHDYKLEANVSHGIDALLKLPDVSTKKACLASQTRGGYYTLKVAVTFKRQERDIACYVSWYPHLQDPNAPEPMQVYGYAKEADDLLIPTLIFIGDQEQYQRRRSIEEAVKNLELLKRPVRLIVYPGVGRGFDFRPSNVRTLADDLASQDALQRATIFIRQHLQK